jgi:hypothetical protein
MNTQRSLDRRLERAGHRLAVSSASDLQDSDRSGHLFTSLHLAPSHLAARLLDAAFDHLTDNQPGTCLHDRGAPDVLVLWMSFDPRCCCVTCWGRMLVQLADHNGTIPACQLCGRMTTIAHSMTSVSVNDRRVFLHSVCSTCQDESDPEPGPEAA